MLEGEPQIVWDLAPPAVGHDHLTSARLEAREEALRPLPKL